jgi:hypothetical protein
VAACDCLLAASLPPKEYLPDSAAPDLVFVEFAINDEFSPSPLWENEARKR